MKKIIGWFIFFLLLNPLALQTSYAEIEGIRLEVDGLSCPFCALGINKNLKQKGGLEGIEVHLKQGVTEAKLPFGKGLDVGKVRQAVQEAGFTLREIRLAVIGSIIHANNQLAIESRGDGTQFLLFDPEHQKTESNVVLKEPLQQRLEQARQERQIVRVSGAVHEHQGLPSALMVETFETLPK